ncbi:MAG: isoprenylcysteine carboxylmethyltransferase family protein [Verrucomicrobia bacterium]|nr:isoprenylcysteine carboxylmethyltransferase family protein [Verrucomicrobiota bacterium]
MSAVAQLELKVPPVAVWLAVALGMKLSTYVAPRLAVGWLHQPGLGLALGLGGVGIAVLGVVSFRRARTTVDPRYPHKMTALVTSGLYRVTRNPMYLGMLLALAGWACGLGQLLPWLFLPLFIAYLNRFQIVPEERALAARFGEAFAAYRARVRRWL